MKLLSSETAASEVIGHLLILFITILGVGMITLYGLPAIYSLEDIANSKNSEQAFTVLDSRASRVTLGESPLQVTNINLGGGTLTVEPNTSFMVVNSSNFNINISMGRVKYTLGDRIVAYEGGGVWAQYAGGGTVMLSPPEIHYNGWTLTLPVIDINGSASVGGKGTAVVSFKKVATIIRYPNANFANPVNGSKTGKVNLNITSDYYKAWADYARTLSYTNVSVNDRNKTVIIELEVISPMGTFSLPSQIVIRDINTSNPNPILNFSVNIFPDPLTQKEIEMEYIITDASGNELQIKLHREGNWNIDVEVDYGGENWQNNYKNSANPLYFDFLNKSMNLTSAEGNCPTWNTAWNQSCNGQQLSMNDIMQHYLLLMDPDVTINIGGQKQKIDYSKSTYTFFYDPGPGALTYLHITENRADVGIS